jgi:hypothetical protein
MEFGRLSSWEKLCCIEGVVMKLSFVSVVPSFSLQQLIFVYVIYLFLFFFVTEHIVTLLQLKFLQDQVSIFENFTLFHPPSLFDNWSG